MDEQIYYKNLRVHQPLKKESHYKNCASVTSTRYYDAVISGLFIFLLFASLAVK